MSFLAEICKLPSSATAKKKNKNVASKVNNEDGPAKPGHPHYLMEKSN
jgi:hypothetical protein